MNKIWVVLLSAMVAAPVFAADDGFYAGLGIGDGKLGVNTITGLSKSSDLVVGGIVGYQINRNFAAEMQYTGIGKATDTVGNTVKGDAFSLTAVGTLPLNESFDLYGKLGVADSKTTTSAGFAGTGTSRTALTYGIGAQYNVNARAGVRLGWDRYGAATADATGTKTNFNADVFGVSAIIKF
ncbi:MAG: porin family protein [Sulfuriferula sp.]|nr:porin family protein [Sulfuriferula sp.]